MNLKDMQEMAHGWKEAKNDYVQDAHELAFEGTNILIPNNLFGSSVLLQTTDWALQQACDRLGPPPYRYIRSCPPELAQENLNYWLWGLPQEQQWMVRGYEDTARAVLSDQYRPVGIEKVLDWTVDLAPPGGTLIRPVITPDYMHLKIQFMDDPDGNYGYGVYIREGETGKHTLGVTGFIQRHICTNSIIFDDDNALRIFHKGRFIEAEIRTQFKMHLGLALKLAVERREAIAKAEEEGIEDLAKVIERLAKTHNFTDEAKDNVLLGTEGKETRMGLVNGISFAAHHLNDPDEQLRLETLAGAILVDKDSLFGRVMAEAERIEA